MWAIIESILWWLIIGLLGVALTIFIGFYLRGAFRKPILYKAKHAPHPDEPQYPYTLASITNSFITKGKVTSFWNETDLIQRARIEAINKAQRTINFETFFMTPGRRADDFAVALAERASAGVEVRLVVDDYGTKDISDQYWARLRGAGIKVAFFNSFNWRAPLDYAGRTHRKLLLIDSKFALVGGAGISDLWDGKQKQDDTQPWLDVEMQLEGEIVGILEGVFSQHWTFSNATADLSSQRFQTFLNQDNNADSLNQPSNASTSSKDDLILAIPGANPRIQFSPIKSFKYNNLICARKRIWLASPYFLPDDNSIGLLVAAKQDGVDVRILTTSERSDKKPVYYASYEHYGKLLKGGVEIYEFQPSMIHAKMLLIDDLWATTGSANFDPRSFCHNEELDICSAQPKLLEGIKDTFKKGFAQSKLVSYQEWQERSLIKHRIIGNVVDFFQWQL